MELAGRLAYYWYLRGDYVDGMQWLEAAIESSSGAEGEALARALLGAGRLALLDLPLRARRSSCSVAHARHLARDAMTCRAKRMPTSCLAASRASSATTRDAHDYHARSLEIWQRVGDAREAARARNYLAFAAWIGDYAGMPSDELLAWWDQIDEDELRALGDPEITVWYLLNRGAILHHKRRPGRARCARPRVRRVRSRRAFTRASRGRSIRSAGSRSSAASYLQARAQLAASLRVHRRLGDRWRCASVLEALAAVSVASDRPARGAVYLGCRRRDSRADRCAGTRVRAVDAREHRGARRRPDRPAFDAGRERGHRTSLDQTVDLSRDVV